MRALLLALTLAMGCSGTGTPSTSNNHFFDVVAASGTFSLTGAASGECTGTTTSSRVTLSLEGSGTRAYHFYDGKSASVGGGVNLKATFEPPTGTTTCSTCPVGPTSTTVLFDLSSLETLRAEPAASDEVTPVFGAMTGSELPQPCGGNYDLDTGWLHAKPLTVAAFRSTSLTFEQSGSVDVHGPGITSFDGTLTYSFTIELQASHE